MKEATDKADKTAKDVSEKAQQAASDLSKDADKVAQQAGEQAEQFLGDAKAAANKVGGYISKEAEDLEDRAKEAGKRYVCPNSPSASRSPSRLVSRRPSPSGRTSRATPSTGSRLSAPVRTSLLTL